MTSAAAQFRGGRLSEASAMAMAGQVALRFPVVGWSGARHDLRQNPSSAKYYFLANCHSRRSPRRRPDSAIAFVIYAGADRRLDLAGAARLHDRRRQLLQGQPPRAWPPTSKRAPGAVTAPQSSSPSGSSGAAARRRGSHRRPFSQRWRSTSAQRLRAERIVALVARLAADRAGLALACGRRARAGAAVQRVRAIAQAPGVQARWTG